MTEYGKTWVLVLAAGEGSRLRTLTTTANGTTIPKQFCSLRGGHSLLQEALQRAHAIAPRERICSIVAAQHRRWWEGPLWSLPAGNVVVQPENRGTANGILLPLLHILERDPDARIVLLPSDHHVRDESVLARSLRQATARIKSGQSDVLLLGLEPEEADPELGYIVPGFGTGHRAFRVDKFVEKPHAALARELIEQGALWNAFIIAATGRALLRMFERSHADIVMEMRGVVQHDRLDPTDAIAAVDLYDRLPTLDFSRDIVEGQEANLQVLTVPPCGWSDLGTPKRVAETLRRIPPHHMPQQEAMDAIAHLNLASQHASMSAAEY
jgi:mannose-1-phosphate guanylyltransferase